MVSKGFSNVITSGRQSNIGEKPSVILYTYINLHAGTPKPQSFLSKSPGLQCSNMVLYVILEKLKSNFLYIGIDVGEFCFPFSFYGVLVLSFVARKIQSSLSLVDREVAFFVPAAL